VSVKINFWGSEIKFRMNGMNKIAILEKSLQRFENVLPKSNTYLGAT